MNSFMLWWDGNHSPLENRIEKATAYYAKKFGKLPQRVDVNPHEMVDGLESYKNVIIQSNILVIPGNLFVGMENKR